MRHLLYLSLLLIAACAPQQPRTKILGPTPLPAPSALEKACVPFSPYEHQLLRVLPAAQNHADAGNFALLLERLADLDSTAYQYLFEESIDGVTLFLPTNYALQKFDEEYDLSSLSEDRLEALLKTHIILESIWYRNLFDGVSLASNMNAFTTRFSKRHGSDCVIINEVANFVMVQDVCFNGLVYEIDQVLIPDDGL